MVTEFRQIVFYATVTICSLCFAITFAQAQSSSVEDYFLQQIIEMPSKPVRGVGVYLSEQEGLQVVSAKMASVEDLPEASLLFSFSDDSYLIAINLLQEADARAEKIMFFFILQGAGGEVFTTPVSTWDQENLEYFNRNSGVLNKLSKKQNSVSEEMAIEAEDLESANSVLRSRAAEVAGVDEIMALRAQLEEIKNYSGENTHQSERLEQLLSEIDKQEIPTLPTASSRGAKLWPDLYAQLVEVAKKTAEADRLADGQEGKVEQTVERKVALIKSTEGYDVNTLKRELIRLRRDRIYLERRLSN